MPKVALLQMTGALNREENIQIALAGIADAAADGAQIIALQELFAGRYPCQSEDHERFAEAEPIPGPTSTKLATAAREHEVVIIGSLFEKRAAGVYHNTAIVWDADGSQAGMYRKMHIPDDPLYYEKFYFTPGDTGFAAFATRYGKIGVCVCWDQWFPEAARLTALRGAEIIFYPTAIGWLPSEKETYGAAQVAAWQTMMRSHSIANGVYVAAINRVGVEGDLEFWGHSFVSDPYGQIITEASATNPTTLLVDCDFTLIDTARTHWPFLRDRRIDAYAGLMKRWDD